MGAFSGDWLALREAADTRARSTAVVDALREACARRPLTIVDLGAGTGANLRWLAPRLGGRQEWLLVDSDAALLAEARAALTRWAETLGAQVEARERGIVIAARDFTCTVQTATFDLARNLAALALPRACLVTASALLDLVSQQWLEALAQACLVARARVLFALTYDGRMTLEPSGPDDEVVRTLFNRHQRADKGFGAALGPEAATAASAAFARRGYSVTTAASDWRIAGDERRLQAELIDGWLGAAADIDPASRDKLERWHASHRQRIDAARSKIVVGHGDVAGVLPESTA